MHFVCPYSCIVLFMELVSALVRRVSGAQKSARGDRGSMPSRWLPLAGDSRPPDSFSTSLFFSPSLTSMRS